MQIIKDKMFSSAKALEDEIDFTEREVLFVNCCFVFIKLQSSSMVWPILKFLDCDFSTCGFDKLVTTHLYFDLCHLTDCNVDAFELRAVSTSFIGCTISCLNSETYTNCGFTDTKGQCVPMSCPSAGSFVAWKKARNLYGRQKIVKLLVPEDARRVSGNAKQCRVDKATVLGIYELDGETPAMEKEVYSFYMFAFGYKVGETVHPIEKFDDNRWNICSSGIHCFINREDAIRYSWM